MSNIKEQLTSITKKLFKNAKDNSPAILVGLGTAGTITAVIFAATATPKALTLIEENVDTEDAEPNKIVSTALEKEKPVDILKLCWKCYIPTAGMTAISIACFWGAQHINSGRIAALAGAYTIAENSLKEYQDQVVETLGEEASEMVETAVAEKRAAKTDDAKHTDISEELVVAGNGKYLCVDSFSGRYFRSDQEEIDSLVNLFNQRLLWDGALNLNDWYEDLGLDTLDPLGEMLGWSADDLLYVSYESVIAPNGEPCIYVKYRYPAVLKHY